jgi:putative transposase
MPNHVHLLAVPHKKDALARSLKDIHGRFASSWNATYHSSGHVWQGRYYSCPLDESRFYALDLTLARPGRA